MRVNGELMSECVVKVPMTVTEDVCVPVSVSKPRQNCKMVPREECQIMEMEESYQHCSVIADPSERTERRCSQQVSRDIATAVIGTSNTAD